MNHNFDQTVHIELKRDEAIVLQWFLSRELWGSDKLNLQASLADQAELHSLEALLQELIPQLLDCGSPETAGIEVLARQSLLKRHT